MVPGKAATARVYTRWRRPAGVLEDDQLTSLAADVGLLEHGSAGVVQLERPDRYSAERRRRAEATVNLFGAPAGPAFSYAARVEPRPQTNAQPVVYQSTTSLRSGAQARLSVDHYFLRDADWSGGVPLADRLDATLLLLSSVAFVTSQLPINGVRQRALLRRL